ncbi:MAG: hypothetical protein JWL62_81 [Hyphomicrobiales bacterium]|nr:hypothetical protein [Hyphomicrobiales bacterium]
MPGRSDQRPSENCETSLYVNPIWLYDGECVLCSRAVRYTLDHERTPSIRFVAITSIEGRAIANLHGMDPEDPETFLFIEKGVALGRSQGVLALARQITNERHPSAFGPARLLWVSRLFPRFLADRLYDLIARNRYQFFGRLAACEYPPLEFRHRFSLPEGDPRNPSLARARQCRANDNEDLAH